MPTATPMPDLGVVVHLLSEGASDLFSSSGAELAD